MVILSQTLDYPETCLKGRLVMRLIIDGCLCLEFEKVASNG
ncbi:hypothetical protein SPONN_1068 [uncultured Candidatus Thioglobus sp.]|nr:hypothetical protein SPONN_672 [uncultured Candidatus Thioglobus sp.]SMN02439.1 hypothetical protein SPONN_1068 [uncultured Candidatus Thioglobus sp.]